MQYTRTGFLEIKVTMVILNIYYINVCIQKLISPLLSPLQRYSQ